MDKSMDNEWLLGCPKTTAPKKLEYQGLFLGGGRWWPLFWETPMQMHARTCKYTYSYAHIVHQEREGDRMSETSITSTAA